jgi:hypothetical protein
MALDVRVGLIYNHSTLTNFNFNLSSVFLGYSNLH